ncbi:MAG: hypothetical protein NTU80_02405 [Verrucomicrobia bacterium]|nr:hypothetical protein [Verrucomicrobiota bacterium]
MSDTPDNTPSSAAPAPESDALTPSAPPTPEAAPIAPEAASKPKLTLAPKPGTSAPFAGRPGTSAPFSAAQIAAAQKLPSGKFSSPIPPAADEDDGPSPVLTVIAGLAAAAAIAFAYLLFLKTK